MGKYEYIVNWHGELLTGYTTASNGSHAINNSIVQIAKRVDRSVYSVRQHLLKSNKITITQIKKGE